MREGRGKGEGEQARSEERFRARLDTQVVERWTQKRVKWSELQMVQMERSQQHFITPNNTRTTSERNLLC